MRVLSVGYPLFPVSCNASGGAEQILSYIDRELVSHGHRSVVVAAAGSDVAGALIPTSPPRDIITEDDREGAHREYRKILRDVALRGDVDLIHFHGLDFHAYVPDVSIPMLATLHLPLSWYPRHIFDIPGMNLNCVSRSQAAGHPDLPVVHNGIDTEFFRPSRATEDYLLWLGRICPEKGVHIALQVAHRVNARMIIAGPVHPLTAHQQYFDAEVKPLLDEKRQHIGAVGRERKRDLLSGARCLLVPSLVDETSSLVSMEAISCGTPVIANKSGALPEVVQHSVTGYIAQSVEEMAAAVENAGTISPRVCRETALARFDARRMGRDYMTLHALVSQRVAAPV